MTKIQLRHRSSGILLAEGPRGFGGITPFEGNFYIRRKYLRTDALKVNWIPGICIYKFLYVWMDFRPDSVDAEYQTRLLGWMYWLPNPIFPFIWWRVGLPGNHPEILVETVDD